MTKETTTERGRLPRVRRGRKVKLLQLRETMARGAKKGGKERREESKKLRKRKIEI